eukprot:GEMP01047036.1.p1 GENE.GEMP01047036.1~~GEMP01047036.1.p1  ORF type:complete len:257 (+),score=47.30 GEMP01047036.1:622-1392(+)
MSGFAGQRLTFKALCCPLCAKFMEHPSINEDVEPRMKLYHQVRRKALQRWAIEKRPQPPAGHLVADVAMRKMAFYECEVCKEPYYGGEVECGENEGDAGVPPARVPNDEVQQAMAMELVCRGCSSKGQQSCAAHGNDFLGWKCRYCCEREAQYFCFGTTHFCRQCHDQWQMGVAERRNLQRGLLCRGGAHCIFGGEHPPHAENGRDDYALGCSYCAQETEGGLLASGHPGRRMWSVLRRIKKMSRPVIKSSACVVM